MSAEAVDKEQKALEAAEYAMDIARAIASLYRIIDAIHCSSGKVDIELNGMTKKERSIILDGLGLIGSSLSLEFVKTASLLNHDVLEINRKALLERYIAKSAFSELFRGDMGEIEHPTGSI